MGATKGNADSQGGKDAIIRLRLYVAGHTPNSVKALANLQQLCETHFQGKYEVEVVDLLHHPERAREDDIVAIPTLVRKLPPPVRKIIGDLADSERVLKGLELIRFSNSGATDES